MKTQPHALLIAYGGGHVAMLVPIASALSARGWRISFLGLTTAANAVRAAGFKPLGFADFFHLAAPGAEEYGKRLVTGSSGSASVSHEESVAYHGASFAELVAKHGENDATRRFEEEGRQAFLPVDFMARVILNIAPDLVVATNSPRAERAAILAAGQLGIKSACLVDMFAMHEMRWIACPGYADRICVLNDAVKSAFVAHGRDEASIIVTGNPAFDVVNSPSNISAGRSLRIKRGWEDGRTTILWASNPEPARHPFTGEIGDPTMPRRIEAKLRAVIAEDERLRLVIRRHPSESHPVEIGERVVASSSSEPLYPLLHAVDIVCGQSTTVILEAWLAQKPAITVDCSIFTADAPYARMGISRGVPGPEELALDLKNMSGNKPSFPLQGQILPVETGGSATQAIVATLEQLAANLRS